jgi:TrmH family RNA methyltransferase
LSYLYEMLSINQNKLIRSLQQKKYREKHGMFIIEGEKIVADLTNSGILNSENTVLNCATQEGIENTDVITDDIISRFIEVEYDEIKKLSSMLTPPKVFSLVRIPQLDFSIEMLRSDLCLAFEAIRDPGNLGSIIRTADWFGIKNIFCSKDSVDAYNPKVVQAPMGGILRVNIHYLDLSELFTKTNRLNIPIYGTTMYGDDMYDAQIKTPGLVVFGNESKGISEDLTSFFRTKIRIPDHPKGESGSESLNIAASVAVICSEIRRRGR